MICLPRIIRIYIVYLVTGQRCVRGYAGATKYLLDRAGVDCIWVTGTGGGGPHAWNIVKCDGQYYYVDTTWGDPGYWELQGEDVTKEFIAYEYLCCSGRC